MPLALLLTILLTMAPGDSPELPAPAEQEVDFARDIQPILAGRCTRCHGAENHEGGLRLHRVADAMAGGDSGPAIEPGKSAESRLIRYVAGIDPNVVMPPEGEGERLTGEQVALLRAWIDRGAVWPSEGSTAARLTSDHWAYQPAQRPELPAVRDASWPRIEIDRFVLARIEAEGMSPSPESDRARFLRRVSLDLTGLPPTPDELATFLADERADAYEHAVDRLLASPAYGERWAAWWLDLARYADTNGYEKDSRRSIWRYRDWVIEAFNRNLPFDEFTIEQLAGDLLPQATVEQQVATSLHRNTMNNSEGGTDNEEFRVAAVIDRVNTTLTVWMATTIGCAQCHSHKYDPFTQRDYYRLFAFFNNTADADTDDLAPLLVAPTAKQLTELERLNQATSERRDVLETQGDGVDRALAPWEHAVHGQIPRSVRGRDVDRLRSEIAKLAQHRPVPATTPVMLELPEPRPTHVFVRGSFLSPGEPVTPDVPEVLPPLSGESTRNRLALARWLTMSENPLTARVVVNRIWEQYFGLGLVETSEDFGTQGARPSHPELLDWLATELVRLGWDLKALHREIVTSATYRQSSRATPEMMARDPQNRLLARGPRSRLSAEQLRDQALAISGLLSLKQGGPSVMPPQPEGVWNQPYSSDQWITSSGEDRYRRALYTFWRRTSPYPSFMAFDAPSREVCAVRRPRTNTPLQALTLLNDPVFVQAAQALAARVCREDPTAEPQDRLRCLFRWVVSREPVEAEQARLVELYSAERERLLNDPAAAQALAGIAESEQRQPEEIAERAAWTIVANVLLNLDEITTKS